MLHQLKNQKPEKEKKPRQWPGQATRGIPFFAEAVAKQPNTDVVQVDWQPIAGGDKEMQDLLKLLGM